MESDAVVEAQVGPDIWGAPESTSPVTAIG